MENDLQSFNFTKPRSRKYSQSVHKLFGVQDETVVDNDDSLNDKELDKEDKKPFSLEKLNITTADLTEEIEALKSKKTKKTEGQPAAIKTFCRIRPTDKENENFKVKENDSGLLQVNIDPITLRKFNGISSFTFSKIFDEKSNQKEVFDETCFTLIQEIIQKRKSGIVFTYGMTNAGKTFTVVGSKDHPGILPQSLSYLYEKIESGENGINKFKVFCNFIEIYNEEVFDLLANDAKNPKFKKKVNIKEKDKRFFAQDPTYCEINKLQDFNAALNKGISKKVQCSNNINQNSSRSHTIFKIILKTSLADEEEITLSIVDLAGSERANRTEAQGKELQEACKINQSLSVLGKCMEALKHNSIFLNKKIVPFRESKLTMLFQEYFSGDHNIIMITNINPRKEDFEETMRALNYSCIAKEIKKAKIVVNPIKKLVKPEENNSNFLANPNNASTALDSESLLNPTTKNFFLQDENYKTDIKNRILKSEPNVNPFKIEFTENRMSNSEFINFKDDLVKIKAQLDILTSNNLSNKSIPHPNYFGFPPYMNNYNSGFPPAFNNPFFPIPSSSKEKDQVSMMFMDNNADNSSEGISEANANKNKASSGMNFNKEENVYNNFFSSNSMQNAMNFMHQGFPFLLPSSFQPFRFLNSSNNLINNNFNSNNYLKQNAQNNIQNAAANKDNIDIMDEALDMDSSISNMENFYNNNLNQNRENNNIIQAAKPNLDLSILPSVNTFNMIFINTKINDVNLGYKGRTYKKKNNLPTINKNMSEKDDANTAVSEQNSNSEKKDSKNKKVKKDKDIKQDKGRKGKSGKEKKDKKEVKKKKAGKKDEDKLAKYEKLRNNPYFARYTGVLDRSRKYPDRTNGKQENGDPVNGKERNRENNS